MSNYLPLIIRDILTQTNWNENEISTYSLLLEKGAMNLTDLSQESGIGIPTMQYVIKKLLAKKMITKMVVNDKPLYMVSNVDQMRKWIKGYSKKFMQFEETIGKFIDQYDFNPEMYTPKIRFYEGTKGVKQSYRQMLKECPEKNMCAMFSVIEEIGVELQKFFVEEYVPQRVKRCIHMKNLAVKSIKSLNYQKNDKLNLSETKLLSPKDFPILNTEINLYGDFMHCMGFNEQGAFAVIIKDSNMVALLKAFFNYLWKHLEKRQLYMTDNIDEINKTILERETLYPDDLEKKWETIKPTIKETKDKEHILRIMGHEVMSDYQIPYMKKLADIVTQQGGDILNVGYGLGLIDTEIERYRKERKINKHVVIELNKHLANEASKNKNLTVIQKDWHKAIKDFRGTQFDGIVYDGYPLKLEEVHRDGIIFIEQVVKRNLLKENGILTFFVDAPESFGNKFKKYLKELGFNHIETEKVHINTPNRIRQIWKHNHFLAPILKYR